MSIPVRNVTIKGVFAETATTTIPPSPVAGISYRDANLTEADINKGFPFKTIVDSSQFNEALYEYSSITKLQETYGFVPWSSLTDYEIGSVCLGTDGILYQAKQATGPSSTAYNPVNDTTNTYWKIVPFGSGRNIGEIIQSTIPLTDSQLHLLDGSLLSGSGSYEDFVSYIADLYDSGDYTQIFDTEANWQTAVTTYGVCGKFVYDSVNGTVRLPKITGMIEGTTDATDLGDLVEAGLPNITGQVGTSDNAGNYPYGAFYQSGSSGHGNGSGGAVVVSMDASRSSSVYGNSNTVQPQAINVLYYIVVATSTKSEIEVDIDQIESDLSLKAETDFSNITSSGKIESVGWGMPDYSAGISGTYTAPYTAPSDGLFIYFIKNMGNAGIRDMTVNGTQVAYIYNTSNKLGTSIRIFVSKGDVIANTSGGYSNNDTYAFFPLKGVN